MNLIIRCSSLGKIMTNSRSKSDPLSKTCKSEIENLVKQELFGYKTFIDNKYVKKGIQVEDDSIKLYNEVFFTDYKKNTERLKNDWITGECDINTGKKIIDIKSSWSAETFPATKDDIDASDYEWQLRGYMMLYKVPFAELAYCLVDTPDELLGYEQNLNIHKVSHIDPDYRVTTKMFERDLEIENQIIERIELCNEYAMNYKSKIINKNK